MQTKPTPSEIKTYTPKNGNKFFYVQDGENFICSWDKSFNDTWTVDDLESTTPIVSGGLE